MRWIKFQELLLLIPPKTISRDLNFLVPKQLGVFADFFIFLKYPSIIIPIKHNYPTMDPFLLKILVLVNILLVISTIINVIHKLEIIQGPNAHIAIAILSILVLFGYSGVLNTVFLKRRFHRGRIIYLLVAGASQLAILILSFLSYYNVMTYFLAIAIIHAIMGFITMVNFTCAVIVVYEQQL